jgi:phosphate:Na+ symporter
MTGQVVTIVGDVVGGLCVFLLGMKYMSEGMQAAAGGGLRRMISAVTDNRLMACATGAAVTALIQSSSVTTVMLIGMVNAGVMTLVQAIGVILGADIGTTVTAWIVALKVTKYGLPLLGVSGFFYLFTRSDRVRFIAMMVMGIGMVFFGLSLMKMGFEPLREMPEFVALFSRFSPTSYGGVLKCILAGALVTAVVQSSSATIAITITLARTDVIGFDSAVALVLGQNVGTTITAFLASLGASRNAKRVAYAHVIIKVVAVALMAMVFFPYMSLLRSLTPETMDVAKRIAVSHTLFNVCLVFLFLPLRSVLATMLMRLVPDSPYKEPARLTFLDVRLLDSPAFGLQQSSDEIRRMGEGSAKMLTWMREILEKDGSGDAKLEKKVFHREEVLDIMQKEIVEFLSHLLQGSVSQDMMDVARKQLRYADEYESISDYVAAILKLRLKLRQQNLELTPEGRQAVLELHDMVSEYMDTVNEAVESGNEGILSKARSEGERISRMMKNERAAHLVRMEEQRVAPLMSLGFVDMLQSYRKIKDHTLNIAEALCGEK